jgi:ketosteroid isomerase-like protein
LDNCFDEDFVFTYIFNLKWTKDEIMALKAHGQLKYYESFPKPMFNIRFPDGTVMKGVEGTEDCRLIFNRDEPETAKKYFEETFSIKES